MSSYKTFAIWGAGNLGGRIAENFLERKAAVIILTRSESARNEQNTQLSSKGAEIRPFDVSAADAVAGLKGVDVLISTIGTFGLALQSKLVDAAHAAGVKLFVPTEFGDTTDGRSEPIFQHKVAVREQAVRLGLPTVAVFSGVWTEWYLRLGFDVKSSKITINGQGDAQISTTSIEDVAYFVAYVLTTLPRDQLENAKFTLQGDVISFNSLARSVQEFSPKPIEIVRIPRSVFEDKVKADPNDAFSALILGWDTGKGLHPGKPSHDLVPGWQPKKALDVLRPLILQKS